MKSPLEFDRETDFRDFEGCEGPEGVGRFEVYQGLPYPFSLAQAAGIDVLGDLFKYRTTSDKVGAWRELRDRYFPDADTFDVGDSTEPIAHYTVPCDSHPEERLARRLQPDGVTAEFILNQATT